ncbi:hypothetical protein IBTHAUMO2_410008 [Nitrosopumilaceae archaeon]|nr:tetratricopeptide repeat protein [Nitrosopumilus sp.]MDA7944416.1 tetratricopeptide repeat protein [Nitrosopumilus sp.]MDA7954168.1 tetratricopeptide repeat protein [Nitrosopumilus sp.]MDA7973236.1 tetratricopeptide repeat protein [Nitrosopumilus sp.]CAI9831761.1 hypothetical protein IBTHAUMO2_410008 [Nitrosopumilaceae archaeon]
MARRMIDVRPFKRPHIGNTEADLGAIMFGFRHNMWDKRKIPTGLVRELQKAYPKAFPPVRLERLDDESALRSHDEALKERPGDPAVLNSRGVLLMGMGRDDEAAACFDEVLGADPGNPRAQVNKARSLSRRGMYAEALEYIDGVLDGGTAPGSGDPPGPVDRGAALAGAGRHEDAVKCYDAALDAQNCHIEMVTHRGFVLGKLGRREESWGQYEKILYIMPDYRALLLKGQSLAELGRHEDAVKCYDRILNLVQDGEAAEARDASLRALGRIR